MRTLALALSICSLVACGKDGGKGGGGNADAPPLTGDKFSVGWGPVTVPVGTENTQCIWVRLTNETEIKVHQMHDVLSTVSHHLIVYRDDKDTTEQATPVPCQPFTGALNTSGMIMPLAITQKKDDEITLPDGVAYTLAPHQMVKLEMHYINSGDMPQDATASVDLYVADPATIHDEAAILFTGSPDVMLTADTTPQTLHQFFTVPDYLDLSQSHIFAITGHEHHLGTAVKVAVAPSPTGAMTEVYNPQPFEWAEPATATFATPFSVPKGGGLDMTCTWVNTTGQTVKFGESATDEMCFFWAYYYPSQGSKVCIHTDKYGGAAGLNICCPGDSSCSLISGMF